jgi:hypothetical protein
MYIIDSIIECKILWLPRFVLVVATSRWNSYSSHVQKKEATRKTRVVPECGSVRFHRCTKVDPLCDDVSFADRPILKKKSI